MRQRPYPTPPPPRFDPDQVTTMELPRIREPDRRWYIAAADTTITFIGAVLTGASNTTPLDHGIGVTVFALGAGTTGYHLHKWKEQA